MYTAYLLCIGHGFSEKLLRAFIEDKESIKFGEANSATSNIPASNAASCCCCCHCNESIHKLTVQPVVSGRSNP